MTAPPVFPTAPGSLIRATACDDPKPAVYMLASPDPDEPDAAPAWVRPDLLAEPYRQTDLTLLAILFWVQPDPPAEPAVVRGRYYPDMPPVLDGEDAAQYTDRLTGADRTDRRPYDHRRYRQCSIGSHDQCSDPDGHDCECPCHTTPPGEPRHDDPQAFLLVRGSNPGTVLAQGVEFRDGAVALRWMTKWPASVAFHDMGVASVEHLHGNDEKTRIVWVRP